MQTAVCTPASSEPPVDTASPHPQLLHCPDPNAILERRAGENDRLIQRLDGADRKISSV
jgi:hypothetical protein